MNIPNVYQAMDIGFRHQPRHQMINCQQEVDFSYIANAPNATDIETIQNIQDIQDIENIENIDTLLLSI